MDTNKPIKVTKRTHKHVTDNTDPGRVRSVCRRRLVADKDRGTLEPYFCCQMFDLLEYDQRRGLCWGGTEPGGYRTAHSWLRGSVRTLVTGTPARKRMYSAHLTGKLIHRNRRESEGVAENVSNTLEREFRYRLLHRRS